MQWCKCRRCDFIRSVLPGWRRNVGMPTKQELLVLVTALGLLMSDARGPRVWWSDFAVNHAVTLLRTLRKLLLKILVVIRVTTSTRRRTQRRPMVHQIKGAQVRSRCSTHLMAFRVSTVTCRVVSVSRTTLQHHRASCHQPRGYFAWWQCRTVSPLVPFRLFWPVRPPLPSCTTQLRLSAIRVAGS